MKPTRNIVTPNKNLWNSKRKVWFQKNDDKGKWPDKRIPEERKEFNAAKTSEERREINKKWNPDEYD